MMATLFLGGPSIPFVALDATPWWASVLAFGAKTGFFLFLYLWVRWSLPRFRYDQLMALGWRVLLPVALANFAVTGVIVAL
jgi:NADH-quinone oxidoreductase subunit H